MMRPIKIKLLDSTLREAEEAYGKLFSVEEKIEVAKHLELFGVDIIEIGYSRGTLEEEKSCKKICESIKKSDTLLHTNARKEEILSAKNTGVKWVGIWASINSSFLDTKYMSQSNECLKEQIFSSILFAKELGLKTRFTIEDASRISIELIEEIAIVANHACVDRLSLEDTVGAWNPEECYRVIQFIEKNFECEIEVRLHNDMGFALANAHAAIEAGATIINVSVLGIGEVAGICDLFQVSTSLSHFYNQKHYNIKETKYLVEIISRIVGFTTETHRPAIGKNEFLDLLL